MVRAMEKAVAQWR